ncbi:hypothetical protein J7E87_19965 [Streptomyces sp. ISL-1]|uniref:hypothetical protein n=1 Tax=Streptomyces sp. ISL-1 TaxID=2817657 RepID=UPI001BE95C65|nr:hypothetical protein [Streptomyces sp. ISL-1]MBT2391647.1 hypothetical protein [Streptomyces sp. ISL-1]
MKRYKSYSWIGVAWSATNVAGFWVKEISDEPQLLNNGLWVSIALSAGWLFHAIRVFVTEELGYGRSRRRQSRSALRVASMAAHLAGSRRALRDAWLADLVGDPNNGLPLTPTEQRHLASGFVVAAIRMRAHDLLGGLWRPVDWMLAVESRTHGFIAAVVGAQAIYIVRDGGLSALATEIWEPCAILGGGLYVLTRWLRRRRGIELACRAESPQE